METGPLPQETIIEPAVVINQVITEGKDEALEYPRTGATITLLDRMQSGRVLPVSRLSPEV